MTCCHTGPTVSLEAKEITLKYAAGKINFSFQNRLGFTLLEMLVVILIISVTTGLFLGINFRQKESVVIRSFVSELTGFMTAARGYSIVDGIENHCLFSPDERIIFEELRGKTLKTPEGIELAFSQQHEDKYVLALFYPDGSLILEDFTIDSTGHEFLPKADPFMGVVRFEQRP